MAQLSDIIKRGEFAQCKASFDEPVTGISSDTRTLMKGEAFFAISGTQEEGHRFIREALEKGAAAIVVQSQEAFDEFEKSVLVNSTRHALGLAAARWYENPTQSLSLVGITGTNGKTTTTFLLEEIWKGLGITSGLIGTVEYHLGKKVIPSSLTTPGPLELQKHFSDMKAQGVTHAVMEVSSIALDQSRISGTQFKVVAFTNLTQDHLDYHGDMDKYFAAKTKLFKVEGLEAAVVNLDDPKSAKLAAATTAKEIYTYSLTKRQADFFVQSAEIGRQGTVAKLITPAGNFIFRTSLVGVHNLQNCLTALASAYALGHPICETLYALSSAKGAPGRLERVMAGKEFPSIFVDYAHTDDALKNVLQAIRSVRGNRAGKIITVFGCGGDRDKLKRPKMAKIVSEFSDVTIVTSDNPRTEDPNRIIDDIETGVLKQSTEYHREENRRRAITMALEMASSEDIVLVAGKGHEDYQIIGKEKLPFDDRNVVREHYH